ncbi:MAG: S53 family peptidase [Pelomonas sp.]|nr:S53 family peptidase [Roseateles sp.]
MPGPRAVHPTTATLSLLLCAALSACGGGSPDSTTATLQAEAVAPAALPAVQAQPSFHLAPVMLDEPDDADRDVPSMSALRAPHAIGLSADQAAVETRGLTVAAILANQRPHIESAGTAQPAATTAAVVTYTPAQIRAAYGMAALPATAAGLSAAQAAQQGAGQTIYIVDANNDPNAAAELAAFNAKFGLPTCTTQAIAASSALPLAAASTTAGCTLAIVYATAAGGMTANAPAYDSGWQTEIALDLQWAHATAPRARLVLIEVPDSSTTSLLGGVKLANAMGKGVVSMSFGGAEGSWMSGTNSAFAASGMSYVAAAGDGGAGVSWPAAEPSVLAVGGTTLSWSGSGTRSEVVWSKTGGGASAYFARPSYQTSSVPGMGASTQRLVSDVSFNADPNTGQYVAIQPQGGSLGWVSAGGTSLSTPQWAGLLAVSNALRASAGAATIGDPHAALYTSIASVPGNYAAALADVTSGSNGSCALCSAHAGYDTPTGLGTPNTTSLLTQLSGVAAGTPSSSGTSAAPAPANSGPQISASAWTATHGKAFSGTFSVKDGAGLSMTISISGIPSGMNLAMGSGGVITATWAAPVTGKYTLSIKATDSAGLSSNASLLLTVQ